MNPEDPDGTLWIAKVKKFVKDIAHVSWYYRPEDTKYGRLLFQGKNEILYSDHTSEVSIDAIERSCKVHMEGEYERLKDVDANDYACRSKYDPVKEVFTDDTNFIVYCTCQFPCNPDMPMIQCETCKTWFHPPCVGINTKAELDKITTFSCKQCKDRPTGAQV